MLNQEKEFILRLTELLQLPRLNNKEVEDLNRLMIEDYMIVYEENMKKKYHFFGIIQLLHQEPNL